MDSRDPQIVTQPVATDLSTPAPPRPWLVTHSQPTSDRQRYFDHYWETRRLATVDHRTRLRIGLIDRLMEHREGRLLDVGCGRGCAAAYFAERGFAVNAIDLSPMAVEWTRRQHHRITASIVDLEADPVHGTYDVILCLEVLQQIRQPAEALCKLKNALSEGGELIVSLPNEFHLLRRLNILSGKIDFGGIEDSHIKFYTVKEHMRLLDACGLTVSAMRTQSVIPPRWGNCRWHDLANHVSDHLPGLFALSVVYNCRV